MGKCISRSRRHIVNTEESQQSFNSILSDDSNPSLWSQDQVIQWLATIDLNIPPNEKSKLFKKFKRHKINGDKLTQLTETKLKEKLKINPIGLRLELMKEIITKQSVLGYPSPLHHNKYILPQYYPCDYQMKIVQNKTTNQSKSVYNKKDRLSWTIGTVVLLYFEPLETWLPAQIIETCKSQDTFLFGIDERLTDYITVIYDLGNGIFDRKKMCRFDQNQIQSDERFLRNRWKLQSNCIIEIFNKFSNEWIPSYIKSFGSNNQNDFIIENNGNNKNYDLRYNRWHPKIRCSETLLNLNLNSELHVYTNTNIACCAKIQCIYNNDYIGNIYKNKRLQKLDIFKVIYKTNNNKYYYKYIHQFSANILLIPTDTFSNDRPSDYTDLDIIMSTQDNNPNIIKHDPNDQLYVQLLLKGWLKQELNKFNLNEYDNLFTLLMNEYGYFYHTPPIYGLIMYLESKYWSQM